MESRKKKINKLAAELQTEFMQGFINHEYIVQYIFASNGIVVKIYGYKFTFALVGKCAEQVSNNFINLQLLPHEKRTLYHILVSERNKLVKDSLSLEIRSKLNEYEQTTGEKYQIENHT